MKSKADNMLILSPCNLCPRECGSDRTKGEGSCGGGMKARVARAAPHFWEEPCISGTRGSGTVFFGGCGLKCCFCQNHVISGGGGEEVSDERLADIFLELQQKGVHNINLVTPSHYSVQIMRALGIAKPKLHIPIVYNTSGYEKVEAIRALAGYVNVYLPDLKYFSSDLSQRYSGAKDYFKAASAAIKEMVSQTNGLEFDDEGMIRKGVVIRHLVLPGARKDSIAILRWIKETLPEGKFMLSLMSQYTPSHKAGEYKEINRKVTAFEYGSVVDEALSLGLSGGFIQKRESADKMYVPPFNREGV